MAIIDVSFDGRIYRARLRGTAGVVFADTAGEAMRRAANWHCAHTPNGIEGQVWEKKKKDAA
jgi:hypothetical protein